MKLTRLTLLPASVAVLLFTRSMFAQDCDHDGIPDSLEAQILSTFAPAWRPDDPNDRLPPIPLSWYISHCSLETWYHPNRDSDYNGTDDPGIPTRSTGDTNLTLASIIPMITNALPAHYFYRLKSKSWDFLDGKDPADVRTWSVARDKQDCLYGRVTRLDGAATNYYIAQYYMFFLWNDVDSDRNPIGCPIGNHEGDIVCVEFEVTHNSPFDHRLERAIYHEHGRQVFIDDPSVLDYSAGHPVVYLEKENHEALPWRGYCGFVPEESVPRCVGINRYFYSKDVSIFDIPVAGECDDVPTVRFHNGSGVETLITSVINLGERGSPGPSLDAQFVHAFKGLYGNLGTACCDDPFGEPSCENVDSPRGPPYQGKMWDREWHGPNAQGEEDKGPVDRNYRNPNWPGCKSTNSFLAPISTPISNPHGPYTAECKVPFSSVSVDGRVSSEPDCGGVTYVWSGPFVGGVAFGPTPTLQFNCQGNCLVTNIITLVVSNQTVATTNSTTVTVVDTTPPNIKVETDINSLWPPNHKLTTVNARVTVSDACDPNPTFVLTSIKCDDPDNERGDGNTTNDIQCAAFGTPALSFQLRAERSGISKSRTYTIVYTARDASGNANQATATVSVPVGKP
jgi:hypothetical protein